MALFSDTLYLKDVGVRGLKMAGIVWFRRASVSKVITQKNPRQRFKKEVVLVPKITATSAGRIIPLSLFGRVGACRRMRKAMAHAGSTAGNGAHSCRRDRSSHSGTCRCSVGTVPRVVHHPEDVSLCPEYVHVESGEGWEETTVGSQRRLDHIRVTAFQNGTCALLRNGLLT